MNSPGTGGAQHRQDLADFLRFTQKSAPHVFLVHLRCGATEVEIDARNVVSLQLLGRAREVPEIFADQLGEHGPAGRVLVDGLKDVLLRPRVRVHAKELGEEIIRCAIMRDHAHEREVGHVLHGSQRSERPAGLLTGGEGGTEAIGHAAAQVCSSSSSGSSDCCFSTRSRISVMSSTASKTERAT